MDGVHTIIIACLKGGTQVRMPQYEEGRPDTVLLISVSEAARRLRIGRTAAYALVLKGELQSVKIGRSRRVVVSSLEAYIQQLLCNDD